MKMQYILVLSRRAVYCVQCIFIHQAKQEVLKGVWMSRPLNSLNLYRMHFLLNIDLYRSKSDLKTPQSTFIQGWSMARYMWAVFIGLWARVLSDKGAIEVRSNDLRNLRAVGPHFFPLTNSSVWPLSQSQPIKPGGQQRLENLGFIKFLWQKLDYRTGLTFEWVSYY